MLEYLQYPFFVRALVTGVLISFLLSWFSTYVVLRKEVLLTHSLSNIAFLGVALAVLFDFPVTLPLLGMTVLAAFVINYLQRKKLFHNDSLLAIFSQIGLALSIIVISFFPGYRVNLEQFLFGDILAVTQMDMYLSIGFFIVIGAILVFAHSTFLKISLSDKLSQTLVVKKKFWHGIFLLSIALTIGMAMKIVGILLVAAFTTIPANTAKLFARNMRQNFVLSIVFGLMGTLIGLYISSAFDVPTGATIVMSLVAFWFAGILLSGMLRAK